MELFGFVAIALVSVRPANLLFCETRPSLPSPAYLVHIHGLRASTMSPDEKYLAAFVVERLKGAPPIAEVQLWDFRSGNVVQAHSLPAEELRPKYPEIRTYIRYTSDGQLLAVYTGWDVLHVLRASDLEEVRTIQIHSRANGTAFEVSPTGHRAAVRMSGDVRVYDLDSGDELRSWSINQYPHFEVWALLQVHPQLAGAGLAWHRNGTALAISVADNPPCLRGGGTIYIFDLTSEKAVKSFRVNLLPATIAFGSGNSLYIASNTCGGYFNHWTLDLPIFDSTSGHETGKIPAGRVGVRNYIAISANKQVLLAYADREKTTFEGLEDTLKIEDEQWQVWDLATGKLILTLPPTNSFSLSSSGRFAYANRADELYIFSVPLGAK